MYRELHDDSVAHDNGWNERGIGLIEWIVERPTAKHHSKGSAANLGDNT